MLTCYPRGLWRAPCSLRHCQQSSQVRADCCCLMPDFLVLYPTEDAMKPPPSSPPTPPHPPKKTTFAPCSDPHSDLQRIAITARSVLDTLGGPAAEEPSPAKTGSSQVWGSVPSACLSHLPLSL